MQNKLEKQACLSCSSRDGLQPYNYPNSDRLNGWCFSCHTYFSDLDKPEKTYKFSPAISITKEEIASSYPFGTDPKRKIGSVTCEHYGVKFSVNEMSGIPDTVYYPAHIDGDLSGYKVRGLPKDFKGSIGNIKGCDLFGWNTVDFTLKNIIITEGEEDALAISEVIYSKYNRRPNVVSLLNGSGIDKSIKKVVNRLEEFEKIILCFDNDDEGQKAISTLSLYIKSEKIYTMHLSEKDASDCHKKGKDEQILENFIHPFKYTSKRIARISEFKDEFFSTENQELVLYPKEWRIFNSLTEGLKLGDLDLFTGASSNGKTQLFREIVLNLLEITDSNVGCLFLEESQKKTMYALGGMHIGKRTTIPSVINSLEDKEKKEMWDFLSRDNRICLKKNKKRDKDDSELTDNEIFAAVSSLIKSEHCRYIIIDHLDMIPIENSERVNTHKKTEEIIRILKNFATDNNVWIGLAAHLRKGSTTSTPFEKGAIASQEDLKGASGIYQRADGLYYIQRNRTHSIESMRDISRLHVLKSRDLSRCGEADFLRYDQTTGRMSWTNEPEWAIIETKKSNYDSSSSNEKYSKRINVKNDF